MSKRAAYYYFVDKVNRFFAVVQYCYERLKLFDLEVVPATPTAESFWRPFAELHRQPMLHSFEQPWLFAAVRAAEHLSPAMLGREPLATFARWLRAWVVAIVKRGAATAARNIPALAGAGGRRGGGAQHTTTVEHFRCHSTPKDTRSSQSSHSGRPVQESLTHHTG